MFDRSGCIQYNGASIAQDLSGGMLKWRVALYVRLNRWKGLNQCGGAQVAKAETDGAHGRAVDFLLPISTVKNNLETQ